MVVRFALLRTDVRTVANLARLTGIERTRLHRGLSGDYRLTDAERDAIGVVLDLPPALLPSPHRHAHQPEAPTAA
jgi:hypothetical protein